ncbi:hypothetical protein [Microscilla marina]|uniref:Uncharacterized protein n=1 Tax=Microscilla marina ATCC 23134 TaxID=313606 RepID=A1ZK91_MICM2|nr:hypothetical protein [Microscilla marina]EAY29117.1 hypothetical protein M23134_02308 [Microscilla marina ATCC 23134]
MKALDKDWLTSHLIDFEYKKYILLAYLKDIRQQFDRVALYPYLSDMVFHYKNLLAIKENKEVLFQSFPETVSKADFETLSLHYKKIVESDEIIDELEAIIEYAAPQFKTMLSEGKDIFEYIEENIEILPVGITPLHFQEGYFFLQQQGKKDTQVYEYQVSIFESANEKYRGIHTSFVESITRGIGRTFESLKLELIRKYKKLPNPATYLINSQVVCPVNATLLPVSKRMLMKYLATVH